MKKTLIFILTAAMCVTLLTGCVEGSTETRNIPSFPEMEYSRPDIDELRADTDAVINAVSRGCTLRKAAKLIDRCYTGFYNFQSMSVIAGIRADQHTADEYYAEESLWCENNMYIAQQLMEDMYYACAESRFAKKLEKNYFWEGFCEDYSDENSLIYSDECVELMQQESELKAEYYALMADPIIRLDGDEVHFKDCIAYPGSFDYNRAMRVFCEQYNERISDIYIRLIRVRKAMAELMGYESYEQMQYDYFFRRDFTPEEAQRYIEDVKTYIVPLGILLEQEDVFNFASADAMDSNQALKAVETAARSMGGDIEEAFDFMLDKELYDVARRNDKLDMSYETYIADYEAPYLFFSPLGDTSDVLGIAHEFGHYVDSYVNYDADETIDLAECFSQAMEYLVLDRLNEFMDEDEVTALKLVKLLDTVDVYLQQASFAEFENRVYETEDDALCAEFFNELSLQLAKDYGYYDGVSETYYAMSWVMITHFFEQPFYVISYPVSNDIAMQIYALELEESGRGLEMFMKMLPRQSEFILESAELAGLESPFADGMMERTAETLVKLVLG